ncbi:MAG: alpha/beta hydrolase, partial [Sphingobacteriales bacterium]
MQATYQEGISIVNGIQLHTSRLYLYPGRPTIVFLHDSLGCIALWRDFPQRLGAATQCNVFLYDRQGYGRSEPFRSVLRKDDYLEREVDVLMQVLDHAGIAEPVLFGHSDGGTIALLAAAANPLGIAGVITEGAHVFVEDITLEGIRRAVDAYHS